MKQPPTGSVVTSTEARLCASLERFTENQARSTASVGGRPLRLRVKIAVSPATIGEIRAAMSVVPKTRARDRPSPCCPEGVPPAEPEPPDEPELESVRVVAPHTAAATSDADGPLDPAPVRVR